MRERMKPYWPLLFLAGAVIILCAPLLRGETPFWGLPSMQFYPWRQFATEETRAGRLPLWNPYLGAGAPLLANYQTAALYPPNFLRLLLPGWVAMNANIIAHLLLSGAGMLFFARALGIPTFGAGVSAVAWALSTYTTARLGSFPTVNVIAWVPWVFWGTHHLAKRPGASNLIKLALAGALMLLAGHAQTSWYALLGAGLYALRLWWARDTDWRGLLWAAGGIGLGAGIAAAQLIPTIELMAESQRSGGLSYAWVTNFSYAPLRLLGLLMPDVLGSPADGTYLEGGVFFEYAAYIGVLPLLLALGAVGAYLIGKGHDLRLWRDVPFFALLALIPVLIAAGDEGSLFPFLYENVPTFNQFQGPVRWLVLTVFSLCVLAGIATTRWGRGKWLFYSARLTVALGAGMAAVALVGSAQMPPEMGDLAVLVRALVALGAWVAGSALLTLHQPDPAWPVNRLGWKMAVLAFITLDLIWAGAGHLPTTTPDFYDTDLIPKREIRAYWQYDYEEWSRYERLFDFGDYAAAIPDKIRSSGVPNISLLDHVPLLNNFDPMQPGHTDRYLKVMEGLGSDAVPLLRAAGVGRVYGTTRPEGWTGEAPVFDAPGKIVRAWWVPRAEAVPNLDAALIAVKRPGWDPAQTVIIEAQKLPLPPEGVGTGTVEILEEDPQRVRLDVNAWTPGYLVLADTWYPGWRVYVGGGERPIYRANGAFRAVALEPGRHEVIFSYEPVSVGLGFAVSGVSLVMVGMLAWIASRSRA